MKKIETTLKDVYIIEPKVFGDNRGWFTESWSKKKMEELGLYYDFVQDNHSYSSQKGVLRGLHLQVGEASQAKLVRCIKGAVYDVVVDLRILSPTYMKWEGIKLSSENKLQILIPKGFAHGFLTLTDEVEVLYKTDNYYDSSADRSIRWNDDDIGIEWGIESPILSDKDKNAPLYRNTCMSFNKGCKR